ncbi:MAG: helix-turn-helix domain-containing protein [Chloroflexi bacterium]|nr:helix-turn-helix domain-containing protein [Chloroflexota bacterium]
MSVETSNRVWKQSGKGGTPLLLLLAMADWSDDWGYCHPSIEQMAAKCRQTERNILNLIADLEKSNELRRLARGKGGRGKGSGSVYQVITGLKQVEITASEQSSPLARETLAKLASGEVAPPSVAKPPLETDEKISGETFSPEKQSRDFSPVSIVRLNELINVSDSSTPSSGSMQKHEPSPEERAEALYRLVRPGHLTLPNSEQRTVALRVLSMYLQRYDSPQAAAQALKPFAAEADARGIRPTNLCWLSEWAAVGQIPKQRNKSRSNPKPMSSTEPAVDYEAIRQRMEAELPTLIEKKDNA